MCVLRDLHMKINTLQLYCIDILKASNFQAYKLITDILFLRNTMF